MIHHILINFISCGLVVVTLLIIELTLLPMVAVFIELTMITIKEQFVGDSMLFYKLLSLDFSEDYFFFY